MFDFLADADAYLTTFWYIAIAVSLLFIIQIILTFAGIGGDMDADVEIDDPEGFMEYFTIRNAINFLMGFGWAGVLFYDSISNKFFLILTAVVIGFAFVVLYFYLIQQIKKFEEDNTFNPVKVIGAQADVYLRIPGNNEGHGIITVSYKGTAHELDAITFSEVSIPTGSKVIIEDIQDDNRLIVRKCD